MLLLPIDSFLALTYAIIASEVIYLGYITLPKSRLSITLLNPILVILVIHLASDTFLAYRVSITFSSSIPVRGTKLSTYSIPSSLKRLSSVPSPLIMTAPGSSSLNFNARSLSFSIIFTSIPMLRSCFAR